jgi:predicted HTH transcriptional regulator
MNTNELERLLEAAVELPGLDFKSPMAWDVRMFVKDILAMANTEDGGVLVIGVSEETHPATGFKREGVTPIIASSYKADVMKDQVEGFADPFVEFSVDFVVDLKGLNYVVIRVSPFFDQPVICKQEGKDVHKGDIYYRKPRGRPQSCRIDSAHDMRNLLMVAHARMSRTITRLGLQLVGVGDPFDARLDDELEGL